MTIVTDTDQAEISSIHKKLIWICVPEICEQIKNEVMAELPETERAYYLPYPNYHSPYPICDIALRRCEGITYFDKVVNKYGQKRGVLSERSLY